MNNRLSFIVLILLHFNAYGQMSGTEQIVPKQAYIGSFYVYGDKDTYYPVVFKYADQNKVNHLRVFRSYSEAGPDELSSTHKGGLTLEIDANYGGWGGSTYDWRVMDLRQTYHTTFAGGAFAMHYKGFVVWLRGGGFLYHYESEKSANLQVAYSAAEKIFDHANDVYDAYAPAPRTSPDDDLINAHRNDHWDYIKGTAAIGGIWEIDGNNVSYNGGNVGIGVPTPGNKLEVNGAIRAKEVIVETANFPDYVFVDDYELRSLSEVEAHITEHGHLPGIPSAAEIAATGVSLGDSQRILLEKIEELTLYAIEKEKEVSELKERLDMKEYEMTSLTSRLERIEQLLQQPSNSF